MRATPASTLVASPRSDRMRAIQEARVVMSGALGFLVGGVIGFLLRPSAFLVGQLPLEAVVTRGASLRGLDQVLVPLAQQSFNYLLTGALIGAVIGVIVGFLVFVKSYDI